MYVGWTDERVERAKALWDEGRTGSEIAAIIGGCSRNAVIGLAYRRGWSGRNTKVRVARSYKPRASRHVEPPVKRERFTKTPRVGSHMVGVIERVVLGASINKRGSRFIEENAPITYVPPPPDTMPAQVSFNDLEAHHCRAIVAEHLPFDADRKIYCGERREPGKSYCACHVRRYENTIPATAATRAVVQGVYRAPGKNFGVGHTARVNEFLTETT